MLHVIGAGFPRTGTSSMKAALERLGFGPCHHMFEVITRPDQVARWLDVLRDGPVDWDAVLAGYRSAVDWPAGFFWRELAAAHQDAKVILTVRDPRRWYVSMRDTIFQATVTPIPEGAHPYLKTTRALRESLLDGIWRRTFGVGTDTIPGERESVAAFERHVAEVKATVPADRLLVFEVTEGWGPLCGFLGVPVPDEPFPHLNDGDAMRDTLRRLAAGERPEEIFGQRSPG